MSEALTLLAVIGGLGASAAVLLAWADRRYPVSAGALVDAVDALLPQTQCAQCGYPGCLPYAHAVVGGAPLDLCPPGGPETAHALSELLGRPAGVPPSLQPAPLARIDEARCTGCGLCAPVCPVDAIVGAPPLMHTVLTDQCTGCALCLPPCPVDCIELAARPIVTEPRPVRIMARPRNRLPDAPQEACIRCALCVPVCPVALEPQELHWYTRDAAWDDAAERGLDRCIECGLCNQVCPSNIDLLTEFTRGRQALATREREAVVSAEARVRFALRETRLAARAATREIRRESRLARGRSAVAPLTTRRVMLWVLAGLVPGFALASYCYGPRYLVNLLAAGALAIIVEALLLRLRGRSLRPAFADGSALVTAALLVLALPPTVPWYVLVIGVIAALGLGKQVYGGLGNNPFNPAVVGYAIVLLSFPGALASWPTATDGLSGATALTAFKYREGLTVADVWRADLGFGTLGGNPAEWLNLAFLAGGLVLAVRGLLAWRVPVALLGTLGVLALAGYDQGSSASLGSPLYHWFSGATMLGAWFFATDPVTHPASPRGQLLFGCLVGSVTFAIRAFGAYPDGLAFGILLGNGCSAWLDRPRASPSASP